MALRVLLADESSTIKKAIQMVLSSYGVEIKTVPTGIDVLSVTQSFNPDIIMADILLNKKNGYEVCLELKNTAATQNIPVVLMWSSFMQLDQQLFKNSKADASLEKPFETEVIKSLIERLVPKMQTFPLKGLLNHAPLPDFEESDTFVRQKHDFNALPKTNLGISSKKATPTAPVFQIDKKENETIDEFKDDFKIEDSFRQTPAAKNPFEVENSATPENDEWSASPANQFIIETENFGDFEEVKVLNPRTDSIPSLKNRINEQIQTYLKDTPVTSHKAKTSLQQKSHSSFDEQLIKEEIKLTAEKICWQIIPEITEKIVREELAKLLQGIEKNI